MHISPWRSPEWEQDQRRADALKRQGHENGAACLRNIAEIEHRWLDKQREHVRLILAAAFL
jgi:hypothetical protein